MPYKLNSIATYIKFLSNLLLLENFGSIGHNKFCFLGQLPSNLILLKRQYFVNKSQLTRLLLLGIGGALGGTMGLGGGGAGLGGAITGAGGVGGGQGLSAGGALADALGLGTGGSLGGNVGGGAGSLGGDGTGAAAAALAGGASGLLKAGGGTTGAGNFIFSTLKAINKIFNEYV